MNRLRNSLAISFALAGSMLGAQTPPSVSAATGQTAAQPAAPPSQVVQPALNGLVSTLDSVRVDKWKASSSVRQGAQANMDSVRRDLDSNLPSLLHVADGAPTSLPAVLPAARNLDALYDVVLRVAETARVAAPHGQSSDLDAALANLDQARRKLSEQILAQAQANQAEMQRLRQQVSARAAAPPTEAPKPCPAPPAKKKHVSKKPLPAPPPS